MCSENCNHEIGGSLWQLCTNYRFMTTLVLAAVAGAVTGQVWVFLMLMVQAQLIIALWKLSPLAEEFKFFFWDADSVLIAAVFFMTLKALSIALSLWTSLWWVLMSEGLFMTGLAFHISRSLNMLMGRIHSLQSQSPESKKESDRLGAMLRMVREQMEEYIKGEDKNES